MMSSYFRVHVRYQFRFGLMEVWACVDAWCGFSPKHYVGLVPMTVVYSDRTHWDVNALDGSAVNWNDGVAIVVVWRAKGFVCPRDHFGIQRNYFWVRCPRWLSAVALAVYLETIQNQCSMFRFGVPRHCAVRVWVCGGAGGLTFNTTFVRANAVEFTIRVIQWSGWVQLGSTFWSAFFELLCVNQMNFN